MNKNAEISDIKRLNKIKIAKWIAERGRTSKAEISVSLKLSMPTTLQNVKELVQQGIVIEEGDYQSTGGRKAKMLAIAGDLGYVIGVDITRHHMKVVAVNLRKELLYMEREQKNYEDTIEYYEYLGKRIDSFVDKHRIPVNKVVGVGISVPGIIDRNQDIILKSHVLEVENLSLKRFCQYIKYDYAVENDANSAAYAAFSGERKNAVYLSLSDTVGGAVFLQNKLYLGENYKSAEFGHMIIKKDGRPCYCGKRGCMDAYCSAKVLKSKTQDSLELFFGKLREQDEVCRKIWDEYLEYLAVSIANLRMIFDCDIILGGYLGGYLEEFRSDLNKKLIGYNGFDRDTSYISTGRHKIEAAAYGATMGFIEEYFDKI